MPPLSKLQRSCLAIAVSQAIALPFVNAATITVSTNTDALGATNCSLRAAIVSVNTNSATTECVSFVSGAGVLDTIDFSGAVNSITLTSDLEPITAGVTINGPGEGSLRIDGTLNYRVFDFNSSNIYVNNLTVYEAGGGTDGPAFISQDSSSVQFDSVTLSNGTSYRGGAGFGYVGSETTFNNCTITNNSASGYGGGLAVGGGATMTLNNTDVTYNIANEGAGIFVINGNLTVTTNSNISSNTATLRGGGIATIVNGDVSIHQSQVSSNKSYYGSSGPFLNGGAGIYAKSSTLTLSIVSVDDLA